MILRRLIEMITRRPAPPNDERSIKAVQLAAAQRDTEQTLDRIDRLVPAPYKRVRREAIAAQRRLGHRS